MINILFIGDLNEFGRSFQRCRTLNDLGNKVATLSHTQIFPMGKIVAPSLGYRLLSKLRIPPDLTQVNKKMLQALQAETFDVIWIEKGNMIYPTTLRFAERYYPEIKLVSCSEDDMFARHGHSLFYRLGLKYYDVVFTTKKYNLDELKLLGARCTRLFLDSFDEQVHQPMTLTSSAIKKFECDVSAIGAYEKKRAESLLFLAVNGVRVIVWGGGWEKWHKSHPNMIIKNEFLFGDDYSKAICATKVNLNFLRKSNRDEVTSRSIEIPACGGFMLTERTERHKHFFEEGKEAEFFASDEEMLTKVRYYLEFNAERRQIALAGRERCLSSGYSTREQLIQMLDALFSPKIKSNLISS